jgi:hypothetical protein
MRILIVQIGFSTVLCTGSGGTPPELVANWRVRGSKPVEVVPLVDADHPHIDDYKNISHVWSCEVEREHATLEAANIFMLTHAQTMLLATGTFVAVSEDQGSEQTITLHDARLQDVALVQAGTTTIATYSGVCGEVTTTT